MQKAADIQEAISEGAVSFLMTEYKYMAVFMVRSRTSLRHTIAAPQILTHVAHVLSGLMLL